MQQRLIPIAKPTLGEQEATAVSQTIASGWMTQGPCVRAFEDEFAVYVGAPYACAVSSCTSALHLALRALEVGPGDEVVTVSHSFIATANAIRNFMGVTIADSADVLAGNCVDQVVLADPVDAQVPLGVALAPEAVLLQCDSSVCHDSSRTGSHGSKKARLRRRRSSSASASPGSSGRSSIAGSIRPAATRRRATAAPSRRRR